MLPVFITSNQIPLHVHAVFCQLHVHCIHLARGMMRMRIPSNYYNSHALITHGSLAVGSGGLTFFPVLTYNGFRDTLGPLHFAPALKCMNRDKCAIALIVNVSI